MSKFIRLFPNRKPILGMLHLKGDNPQDVLDRALLEARILDSAGVDGVIVENYFGSIDAVKEVVQILERENLSSKLGINILGRTDIAFEMAKKHAIDFIQMDSVAGHLTPEHDADFAAELDAARAQVTAAVLGGVRFKYMPVRSGRSEAEDLEIGARRCDAIVVTSDATGQETSPEKIARFRDVLGQHAQIIVGAGMTATNASDQLAQVNGGIIGSWLKDTHRDDGDICPEHVDIFMEASRAARLDNTPSAPSL